MLGVKMINGIKKSDPIIDYLEITEYSFEEIDEWLTDNKDDQFLIRFYVHYINQRMTELLTKVDDQNASIIRRGFKLLDKWEG